MTAKAMTGAETRRASRRVRDVMVVFFSHSSGSTGLPSTRISKYMPGIPASMRPAVPTTWPRSTFAPRSTCGAAELAVQRKCLRAVIDDDEVAVAGERPGVGDGAVVHRAHRRAFLRGELHAVCAGALDTRGLRRPNGVSMRPATGQSRSPRNGRIGSAEPSAAARGAPALIAPSVCCSLHLRALQLARQLGGEIAARDRSAR